MADSNRRQFSDVAAVIVPLPAQGHLNQLLHFAHRIATHGVPVHYLSGPAHIRQVENRGFHDNAVGIHFHNLPDIPFENPRPDPSGPHKFPSQIVPSLMAATHHRLPVFEYVQGVCGVVRKVVVIYDALMSHVVQDVGSIPNAEAYVFQSISAFAVCAWESEALPDLFPLQYRLLKEAPSVIGYHSKEFGEFLELQKKAKKIFVGEIYNSNDAIEGSYLNLLEAHQKHNIWGIGPFHFIPTQIRVSKNPNKCIAWLDKQKEPDSVIYVSFGTTVSFSDEQIREIAIGLERSRHRFIWVLRDADKGNIFSGKVRDITLPDGFEDRVQDRGLVVRDWVPQLEILGHSSIGGFMSHCGWSSCMESISMGVAMAAWPLHSDQPANAILITKVVRIGIEVTTWTRHDELVGSETVEKAVRELMGKEGAGVRERAEKLGEAVRDSVQEGGATWEKMKLFVDRQIIHL